MLPVPRWPVGVARRCLAIDIGAERSIAGWEKNTGGQK
jgi:hypothetical protein